MGRLSERLTRLHRRLDEEATRVRDVVALTFATGERDADGTRVLCSAEDAVTAHWSAEEPYRVVECSHPRVRVEDFVPRIIGGNYVRSAHEPSLAEWRAYSAKMEREAANAVNETSPAASPAPEQTAHSPAPKNGPGVEPSRPPAQPRSPSRTSKPSSKSPLKPRKG
jgi:hypothetical protein